MPADRLTHGECAQLGSLSRMVDCRRVRVYRDPEGASGTLRRLVLWASRNRAIALGNLIFLPDRCRRDLRVLAHELTHCGQYQAWGPWRYYTRGLREQARDLIYRATRIGSSPYGYTCEPGKPFEAYGMEQQAQIVEDCFRGPKRSRLPDLRNGARESPAACPPTARAHCHRDRPPLP